MGLVFFHDHAHGHSHGEEEVPEVKDDDHGHSHGDSDNHGHSHGENHGHSHGEKKPASSAHGHSHGHNENLYGVFLHILADALGSVAVIISSIFIKYFDWYIADPICCFLISFLILLSVVYLIKSTSRLLALGLQDSKKDFKVQIIKSAIEAANVLAEEGKIETNFEVQEALIWEIVTDRPIVTVKASVRVGENRIK